MLAGFGLHAWLSGSPFWPGLAAGMAVLGSGAILCLLCLGKEFRLWSIDGETLDKMSKVWIGATIVAAVIAYVAAR